MNKNTISQPADGTSPSGTKTSDPTATIKGRQFPRIACALIKVLLVSPKLPKKNQLHSTFMNPPPSVIGQQIITVSSTKTNSLSKQLQKTGNQLFPTTAAVKDS